jgi:hypothetical protein
MPDQSAPALGLINISEKPYLIEITSWRGKDIIDFSPPASVPGSGTIYSDLGLYQPIAFLDFSHGLGFVWHSDEAGYLTTTGAIDTRHSNLAMLFTAPTQVTGGISHQREGSLVFGGYTYFWGTGGLERWSSGAGFETVNFKSVTVDTAAEGKVTAGASLSASFTVGADGSNGMLVVLIAMEATQTVSTITYGGVAMTVVGVTHPYSSSTVVAYRLLAPATGANTLAITLGGSTDWEYCVISLLNVNQSSPTGTVVYADTAAGTSSSLTPAATEGDLVLDLLYKDGGSADNLTIGALQTQRMLQSDANATATQGAASTEPWSTGTTTTASWSWTNARDATALGFAVHPSTHLVDVNTLFNSGGYLFLCVDGERIRKSSTGGITATGWSDAGVNSRAADYSWLTMHGGYIYAGKDSKSIVYYDSSETLASLCGDPADDSTELYAGASSVATKAGVSYNNVLYCPREDGMWGLDESLTPDIFKPVIGFEDEVSSSNFRSIKESNGYLYFTVRDTLYRWNGTALTDITPGRQTATWPFTTYGRFDNFVSYKKWFFYTARDSIASYTESLFAWDGVGTHKLYDIITEAAGSITFMSFDTTNNYLWYGVTDGSTHTVYYIPFNELSDFPYSNFPTTGTHSLTTSRIDCGFRRVSKSSPFLLVNTQNCSDERIIKVEYSLDGDTWVEWDQIKTNGLNELEFPGGFLSVEADSFLQLRFTLSTTSSTNSPILESAILMVMLRPDVRYGYSFAIPAAKGLTYGGYQERRSIAEIKADLRQARDSKAPIALVTPFGEHIYGYISSITETGVEVNEGPGGSRGVQDYELMVAVSFVESVVLSESA